MNDVIRDADGLLYFRASTRGTGTGTADAVTDLRFNEETGWFDVKINGTWVPKVEGVAFGA